MQSKTDGLPLTPEEYRDKVYQTIIEEGIFNSEYYLEMSVRLFLILSRTNSFSYYDWFQYEDNVLSVVSSCYRSFYGLDVVINTEDQRGIWFRFIEK